MLRISLRRLAAALLLSVPALTARAETPAIRAALQPFVDRQELAGAVTLVASKTEVLDLSAIGFADTTARRPMTEDALFWIASMSKPMTAAAVMMLVDEGKIRLDEPVATYLPEFRGQQLAEPGVGRPRPPQRPASVRDLLRHTSGLPFKSPEEAPTLDRLPLREAVQTYAALHLQYEPGTQYLYSNAGINTAARILEVVSGQAYATFMAERLFCPLGMTDTTFWPTETQLRRLAGGHKPDPAGKGLQATTISQLHYPLSDRQKRFPMPAGGLFSTARDVAVFCQMVLNDGVWQGRRLLSAAAVQEMTSRQTAAQLKNDYGLGWSTGGNAPGHGGAMATDMTLHRAQGLITVYLVQHTGFPGQGAAAKDAFQKAALQAFAR